MKVYFYTCSGEPFYQHFPTDFISVYFNSQLSESHLKTIFIKNFKMALQWNSSFV